MKRIFFLPIVIVLGILAFFFFYESDKGMYLCNHEYALCTSALCVPDPNHPDQAICFCDVEEGSSMSTTPCNMLMPSADAHGVRTLYSTYSSKQFAEGKKGMKCPSGTPWTWCLNKRCTVDPFDSKKAICVCDIMRTGEWTTLGGNCDTTTCKTGYYSGASVKDAEQGNAFLMKKLKIAKSPLNWCEAKSL